MGTFDLQLFTGVVCCGILLVRILSNLVVVGHSGGGNNGEGLLVDVRLRGNLNVHVGLGSNLGMDVGLSSDLLMDIGLSSDLLMHIGLSSNLSVNVGLGSGRQLGVGDRGIIKAGIHTTIG